MLPERTLIVSKRDDSVEGELLCSLINEPASDVCLALYFRRDDVLWRLCRSGCDEVVALVGDGRDSDAALSGSSSSRMGCKGLMASVSTFPESLLCDCGQPVRGLGVARALALWDEEDEDEDPEGDG
jgi:hypothetical protein